MQREKAFLIKAAYWAAILAVSWLVLRYALVWLLPFLLALGFAALMEPVIALARRKLRLKRGFLAAVFTLALLALVVTLGVVLVGQLIRQATDLMERLPELLAGLPVLADRITARLRSFCADCPDGVQQWLTQLLDRLEQTASEALGTLSSALLRLLTGLVSALPQVMLFCATTALALFFTSAAYPQLMAQSAGLPPLPALAAMYIGFCAMGVAGMILGPILLLLIKQLHDGGYLRLWK